MKPPHLLKIAIPYLLLLSILLTAAAVRAMDARRRWSSAAAEGVTQFSMAQRALHIDLLNARAGLIRTYDPVNADLTATDDALSRLRELPSDDEVRRAVADLTAATARQEALVERFKTNNALLQNSLARFAANGATETPGRDVLSAWVLKLTLDTSPPTVASARAALAALPRAADGSPRAQLSSHARLLVDVLPEGDRLLRAIWATDIEQRLARLETALEANLISRTYRMRALQFSAAFALALLAAAVVMLLLLQRLQTRELAAQAANARLSAAIAMPLIDTGGSTFVSRVQEAVDHLACHINARRLQLRIPELADQSIFSWPPGALPDDWLAPFAEAAEQDGAWFDNRVLAYHHRLTRYPAIAHAMQQAGVSDLLLLRTTHPAPVLIGFEPAGPASAQRHDHLAGTASALAAIAHGTNRELLSIERRNLDRTLAWARRMEAIGVLASGLAHNFNNIIGAIAGYGEMGRGRTRKGSATRSYFDEILIAARRASDLVDEMLGFAKHSRSGKRLIDLRDILEETHRLLAAANQDEAMFRLDVPDGPCPVSGATVDLQQAFLNICNNAAQAGRGGPVAMVCDLVNLTERRRFSHGSLAAGRYFTVAIVDSGPGVPPEVAARLFEPFFTTKAAGTGLGLSTAWEIVRDHGGTIDVTNLDHAGACFTVWLPAAAEAATSAVLREGDRILLLTASDALSHDSRTLAGLGLDTIELPLSTGAEAMIDAVRSSDAVLVSAREVRTVGRLVHEMLPTLGARPLLLATPANLTFPCSRVINLSHPIDGSEVAALIRERAGTLA